MSADPGCGRVTDPDMIPAAARAHMTPWAWVAAHITQVSMGSAVAQLSSTKKATGWEPRSWESVWRLVATGVTDISIDSGCGRTADQDMEISPGW